MATVSVKEMLDAGVDVSDGYHTFGELYEHRFELYLALCRLAARAGYSVWKSKVHSDGTGYPGWFVVGVNERPGEQITYHLPLARWDEANFTERAPPPFDGHSSTDVLGRLKSIERLPTDAGTGADTSGDEELGFPEPVTRFIPLVRKDAQADAIKAAVTSERERCLGWMKTAFYADGGEWQEATDGIRGGADAPGSGKDGGK